MYSLHPFQKRNQGYKRQNYTERIQIAEGTLDQEAADLCCVMLRLFLCVTACLLCAAVTVKAVLTLFPELCIFLVPVLIRVRGRNTCP